MRHILSATNSKYIVAITFGLLFSGTLMAQTVGVGTLAPNPKAILDIKVPEPASNPQGMLLPRLTKEQRLDMELTSEEKGMLVYDSEEDQTFVWDGVKWVSVGGEGLPTGGNMGEVLTWNGTVWGGEYPIQPFLTLVGNELSDGMSVVYLSSNNPSDGHVLTWDSLGTAWTSKASGLGNHNLTKNLKTNNFWISSSGSNFRGLNIGEGFAIGASERIGVNIAAASAASHFHLHSAQTFAQLRLTTDGTGSTGTDGLVLDINATAASLLSRENTPLYLGTAGQNRFRIDVDGKTSIGAATPPVTTLDVKGSFAAKVSTTDANPYIVAEDDYFILSSNTVAIQVITLPTASSFRGRTIIIKKTSATHALTINGQMRLWDNLPNTYTIPNAVPYYRVLVFISDGTYWNLISESAAN